MSKDKSNRKLLSVITIPVWDHSTESEVLFTKTLEDWVKNPQGMNVEVFGLHILNTLRISRNLEPYRHKILK